MSGGLLVIGYGNTLRADDGIGPRVAEEIESRQLPGVRVLVCHQLAPEHAEAISRAEVVVFVDAGTSSGPLVQLQRLEPRNSAGRMTHAPDAGTVLGMARDLFGRSPEGWSLTIRVSELGFGEELSASVRRGIPEAIETIVQLADSYMVRI